MSIQSTVEKNLFHSLGDGRLSRAAYEELAATGQRITQRAQSIVPVDTGELRDSLGDEGNGVDEVTNYAGAEHAEYVELGTRNQAAQPYLYPAFVAETEGLPQRMGARIEAAAGGG